jgi:hypothetical protein
MNRKRVLAIKQSKAFFQHGVSNTTEEVSIETVLSKKQNMILEKFPHGRHSRGTQNREI